MRRAKTCSRTLPRRSNSIEARPTRETLERSSIWASCMKMARACIRTIPRQRYGIKKSCYPRPQSSQAGLEAASHSPGQGFERRSCSCCSTLCSTVVETANLPTGKQAIRRAARRATENQGRVVVELSSQSHGEKYRQHQQHLGLFHAYRAAAITLLSASSTFAGVFIIIMVLLT